MSRFEIKIVAALLLIAIIPLGASVVLVGQVVRVADGVAQGQVRQLELPLEQAADAYRRLFDALKTGFHLRAQLLAQDPALTEAAAAEASDKLRLRLDELQLEHQDARLMVLCPGDAAPVESRPPTAAPRGPVRDLELTVPLGQRGHRLRVRFLTDRRPFDDFNALGQAHRLSQEMARLRGDLGTYYRVAFLVLFGAVLLAATAIGLFIARRTTRRVALLAAATHKVARGDLETQVEESSRDEMGALARSFNQMVHQLRESHGRIAYLEKIGAWQQVARRLAHEIKNPLTPIQLAVQQVHRSYTGDDPRFRRTLDDALDIVTEEVEGLRRLVKAFSAFAKLPDVQPEPLDVNALLDDFLKSRSGVLERARVLWQPLDPGATLMGDRMLLKHLLFNLVENAIQAAEEAGQSEALQISIRGEVLHGSARLLLEVADNGPGMKPEVAARVFEPYFTTREHGTGLGLAIVKKIVLEHQGGIEVQSEPGLGTRFMLTLPLAASSIEDSDEQASA